MSEANATGELLTMPEKDFDRMYGWFNLQTAIYTQEGSEHPEIVAYVDSPEHVRLFAAAPDMMQAVNRLVIAFTTAVMHRPGGIESMTDAERAVMQFAGETIRKATGGN